MRRRELMQSTGAGLTALALNALSAKAAPATPADFSDLKQRWLSLDAHVKSLWPKAGGKADEEELRKDKAKTLLFLPFPFTTAGGSGSAYPDLYCWDTHFINQALLQHGQREMALNNVRNHLFMIDRFGFVLNGNRTFYQTRSQTPLLWWSVESLANSGPKGWDESFALEALPRLEREYNGYWRAEHHKTPTGLSRAYDTGDVGLPPELAAEAETGLDFTPIFGGDVRNCNPLIINAALIRYATTLSNLAQRLGLQKKASTYAQEARKLSALVDKYCWDEKAGFYFEYDYVQGKRLPFWSVLGYWMMWAGVPSPARAKRMAQHLDKFLGPGGLTVTAEEYPSPHKNWERLQWNHPSAWSPLQIVAMQAFDRYGLKEQAQKVAGHFLRNQLNTWDSTGKLWERYDAIKGGPDKKKERAESFPFEGGWSGASVTMLGNRLFGTRGGKP